VGCSTGIAAVFDRFAPSYDEDWTNSPVGRLQRDAVWRNIAGLFNYGDHVLDMGCGTGEDSVWLMRAGVRVTAIDASRGMVLEARRRGVDAQVMGIEDLAQMRQRFDAALSNFGPLNCVESLDELRPALARLIRPGGHLALCMMGRFCLWESLHPRKALRRWTGVHNSASLGIRIHYPTIRQIRRAMAPDFVLTERVGIGIAVPPSSVRWIPKRFLQWLASIDSVIERIPLFIGLSDHRLLIFSRK
jgi:ubiquinone/menaquinone biosynthesis C-methylase UbiE